jgi:hypothetical protein
MAAPTNVLRTPWEAPESATSPTTTASKGEFAEISRFVETSTNSFRTAKCCALAYTTE